MNIFESILEKLATFFIGRYGKSKSMLLGLFIAICGIFVDYFSILSTDVTNFSNAQTNIGYDLEFLKLLFSLIIASIGATISLSVVASDHTKCKICGRSFGYKEIKRPFIKEINCSDGIRKKTVRYYKCQYCGAEEEVPHEQLIKYEHLLK